MTTNVGELAVVLGCGGQHGVYNTPKACHSSPSHHIIFLTTLVFLINEEHTVYYQAGKSYCSTCHRGNPHTISLPSS